NPRAGEPPLPSSRTRATVGRAIDSKPLPGAPVGPASWSAGLVPSSAWVTIKPNGLPVVPTVPASGSDAASAGATVEPRGSVSVAGGAGVAVAVRVASGGTRAAQEPGPGEPRVPASAWGAGM